MDTSLRDEKQLGSAFRRLRRRAGLTQHELGRRAGLRQATISSLEGGAGATRLSTVIAVLAALDLELVLRSRVRHAERSLEELF
jgi:HTH-type transcriptional regulator/antitoxin HipB